MPRGMSIQAYCSKNNMPYRILDKWIRDIYKRVVPVQVTGTTEDLKIESPKHRDNEQEKQKQSSNDKVSIKVSIITSSGMEVSRDGLDYRNLRLFIEKLEGSLC